MSRGASALWRRQLPATVRAAVAGLKLNDKAHLEQAFKKSDDAWDSMAAKPKPVAAVRQSAEENNDDEVAAFSGARGRGKPNRGRGNGRGRGQSRGRGGKPHPPTTAGTGASGRGDPHPDGPPDNACNNHYRYGRGAYFCSKKRSCPWRDISNPPQDQD